MDKKSALSALAALGQDTRLEVFRLLVRAGGEGIPAGGVASQLGTVPNTMSAHLKVLEHAGLIARGRTAQLRPSRLQGDALGDAAGWLADYREFWEDGFDKLRDHLARG